RRLPPSRVSPLSLHDALPIWPDWERVGLLLLELRRRVRAERLALLEEGRSRLRDEVGPGLVGGQIRVVPPDRPLDLAVGRLDEPDRKSTRLNSSHLVISYAVF